jgi:hypothetical protein
VTAIPVFVMFVKLGLYNTYVPLILPAWLGTSAFFIFLLKQFFEAIPEDLISAARVDGASELRIFLSVGIPLSAPILWVIALFTFIGSWNDYFGPLVYLADERLYPLSIGMTYFLQAAQEATVGTRWNLMMAVATFYTMLRKKPVGRHHLQVCVNVACYLKGANVLVAHLERRLGIGLGEATPDGLFSLEGVQCLAACGTAPALQVDDTYFEEMTVEKMDALIDRLRAGDAEGAGGAA